jgi:hypothetical protein
MKSQDKNQQQEVVSLPNDFAAILEDLQKLSRSVTELEVKWRVRLIEPLPKRLRGRLPTVEEIEKELGHGE